jgi:hypothetical protein
LEEPLIEDCDALLCFDLDLPWSPSKNRPGGARPVCLHVPLPREKAASNRGQIKGLSSSLGPAQIVKRMYLLRGTGQIYRAL